MITNIIPPQFKMTVIAVVVSVIFLVLTMLYHNVSKRGYNKCMMEYQRKSATLQSNARSKIIKIQGHTDAKLQEIMGAETGDDLADPIVADAIASLFKTPDHSSR